MKSSFKCFSLWLCLNDVFVFNIMAKMAFHTKQRCIWIHLLTGRFQDVPAFVEKPVLTFWGKTSRCFSNLLVSERRWGWGGRGGRGKVSAQKTRGPSEGTEVSFRANRNVETFVALNVFYCSEPEFYCFGSNVLFSLIRSGWAAQKCSLFFLFFFLFPDTESRYSCLFHWWFVCRCWS